jgi:hypothetical protein
MSAVSWTSLVRLFRRLGNRPGRPRSRILRGRKTTPGLESLEGISLLSSIAAPSAAAALRLHDAREHRLAAPAPRDRGPRTYGMTEAAAEAPVTLPPQTTVLNNTLTNFTNEPLAPPLNLFDPSLGTLSSVTINQTSVLQSSITSQNLSPSSSATITASLSGSFQINGLNQPIVQPTKTLTSQPQTVGTFGSSNDTAVFPPLQISNPTTMTFTDPASLAFFTASAGRTTVTPTMTANGTGSASAPNGNLFTIAQTAAMARVTVSYTYIPTPLPPPVPCPTVGRVGRIGLHHQRTLLIVPFSGVVNPTIANNPANYVLIRADGQRIRIISANYNPATNTVTLRPAHQLNVHHLFRLKFTLPCTSGPNEKVTLHINRKYSLIGFHNHVGEFVPVHFHNGRLVKGPSPRWAPFEDRLGRHR